MRRRFGSFFGAASAFLDGSRRLRAIDVALLVALGGAAFGIERLALRWTGVFRPAVEIAKDRRAG